jgi:hypothetical protein
LDTHAALWAQLDVKRLGRNARTALAGLPPSALAVCDVTLTETARLLGHGARSRTIRRAGPGAGSGHVGNGQHVPESARPPRFHGVAGVKFHCRS